jgi:hypothetical protein
MTPTTRANRPHRWLYLEQYGAEVLCPAAEPRPLVFATVFKAVEAARRLGGCALGRCLHAPMRWVVLRTAGPVGEGAPDMEHGLH